jgi:hypothetical protein
MALFSENSQSDNPIKAIEEVHEAFRKQIREHCSGYIIRFRWLKKYQFKRSLMEYKGIIQELNLFNNWETLLARVRKEVKEEYSKLCDEWMLENLASFDLELEIETAFKYEWDTVGPRPKGLL